MSIVPSRTRIEMVEQGAGSSDVGGESTRPGAAALPEDEELARVLPVIDRLASRDCAVPISVDTYKAAVARAAIQRGATIINDVSGLQYDARHGRGGGGDRRRA
mgnify:CR=1 FL=1